MSEKWKKRTKGSLSHLWNKQFLVFLFFVFISASFWAFTALNEEMKVELEIPVTLTGVPENVVITTEPVKMVHFTARDKGIILLNYKYAKTFRPIIVEFNTYSDNAGYGCVPMAEALKQINVQVSNSTQISGLRPQQVEFYYNYGEKKRVPVRVVGQFKPSELYYISQQHYTPDSVTVYARREILDTVTAAYTNRLFLQNISDTARLVARFRPVPGMKYSPESVNISVITDRLVEKTVQVSIQQVNFPATKVLRTFPAKASITFQVGMNQYRRITADNFVLVVNYEELLQNNSTRIHLSLKSLPPGVRHARISPQEVEYVIEDVSNAE